MKASTLKITCCTQCGDFLSNHHVMDMCGEDLRYGILRCRCGFYPVIEGILFYQAGGYTEDALRHFSLTDPLQAVTSQLSEDLNRCTYKPDQGFLHRQIRRIIQKEKHRKLARQYVDSDKKPLFELIRHWGDKKWEDYLKYRPSSPTYTILLNLFHHLILSESRSPFILDLCSGLSHFSFLLTHFFPASRIICADISFLNLYFGSRYMAPDADYILLNVNLPLPFNNHVISLCLHVDSFHYIEHKKTLSYELKRVLDSNGILFLAHLHNARAKHLAPGTPLDASDYLDLFGRENTRIYDEEALFQALMNETEISLDSTIPQSDVEKIREITMMVGPKKHAQTAKVSKQKPLPPGGKLSLNPLYSLEKNDETLSLRLKFPSKYFRNEYSILADFLPKHFKISLKEWKRLVDCFTRECRSDEIKEYLRRGILVASPDSYFHPSWPSMHVPPGML